jgi:hypothetical protein
MGSARPKFTAARQRAILEALRAGNYIETAVLAAGIGKSTFSEWCARFPNFADSRRALTIAAGLIGTVIVVAIARLAGSEPVGQLPW